MGGRGAGGRERRGERGRGGGEKRNRGKGKGRKVILRGKRTIDAQ